ncbi:MULTISPECIES: hypothetical protein [Planktothrix]|jgi:hypothetical protein|uniref:DUF4258 domain-containing protein n=5 Tax=Planktothrix TaxID=54304 RepID=A0A073CV98_PLAA1|nr:MULTISPECIES: hypothetical protein [Planktothrix]MCF3606376.1 hypothetical protein [Planktothrix agardhii 1033]CAD5954311.1 hypothetical protein NO108_03121 [Planktothrix rubescens]BBD56267.1 hypothetical protein NIES204_35920 [Planktothrix agardhii NIES-204]KEI67915.1 hypothetical protein A19Y_3085 [Planktothrix agardhii NIVA-CYA 126/8]MBG0746407.1 hypothetical protein [Planktothrix agardhii KL2]
MVKIVWSDYIQYRATLRGFDLEQIEEILRFSAEKYYDSATSRLVVVGKHNNDLVLIPYEENPDLIMPVTIHVTTRQQVRFRLKTGRFVIYESYKNDLF